MLTALDWWHQPELRGIVVPDRRYARYTLIPHPHLTSRATGCGAVAQVVGFGLDDWKSAFQMGLLFAIAGYVAKQMQLKCSGLGCGGADTLVCWFGRCERGVRHTVRRLLCSAHATVQTEALRVLTELTGLTVVRFGLGDTWLVCRLMLDNYDPDLSDEWSRRPNEWD